jgi:hypothetical protein
VLLLTRIILRWTGGGLGLWGFGGKRGEGTGFCERCVDRALPGPAGWRAGGIRPIANAVEETMPEPSALAKTTLRRVSFRLLPLLMLACLVCCIDRVNAGFAALQMNKDIGLTGTVFGLSGGICFIGNSLTDVGFAGFEGCLVVADDEDAA